MNYLKIFSLFFILNLLVLNNFAQESYLVRDIIILGNDVTKEKVIYRELLFAQGDTIGNEQLTFLLERSKENLLNTSLFNFATISYQLINQYNLIITIELQERWYIWPYPVLEHADRNLSSYLNNQEWSRIDYGLFVLINNFRGRKEILKLKTIFGHNNQYVISYNNPFLGSNQKLGLGFELNYSRNRELAYQIVNNELTYIRSDNEYARISTKAVTYLTYRPKIYTNHWLGIRYENTTISDSAGNLNTNYFYHQGRQLEILSLAYNLDFDSRDSKIYPLNGFRFSSLLVKTGLGIYSHEGPFYIYNIVEENLKLSNRFYLSMSFGGKYSFNKYNSFYFTEAIGYENYLRGMEFYVSNGRNYYVSKTNLKFELIPQTKININILPTDKFSKAHYALYCNLFFDTGYVDSKNNIQTSISNELLYSGGIGFDFVTYYDKVLRIEYSLNKFGEHGLFFHLGAPIIK